MKCDSKTFPTCCAALIIALVAGCDAQPPEISNENALRVASCALSPYALNDITTLFALIQEQQPGACPGGGLISRTDTATSSTLSADFCVTADAITLRGDFSSTDINSDPIEIGLEFAELSSVDSAGVGAKFDGEVTLMQIPSNNTITQEITFSRLLKDEIEDTAMTSFRYGPTSHTLTQSLADLSSTIEYSARVEQCGATSVGLTVETPIALSFLPEATSFNAGQIVALADDGTSLAINIHDENLVINLDSNGDQIEDSRFSLTWNEFQGAVNAASRQRDAGPLMQNPSIKLLSR